MSTQLQHATKPIIDAPVISRDGVQVGSVKEVQGEYFKLDVPRARDFWLSMAYVEECQADRVALTLNADEMEDHKLAAPALEVEPENSVHDAVISSSDALLQREHMEQELEAQNARLRAGQL